MDWPRNITEWHEGETGYLSVPFTWLLPRARDRIRQADMFTRQWKVGGPAVRLMLDYFAEEPCEILGDMPGVLQRVNPNATRTTVGCVRRCAFCGVRRIEGAFRELDDWPDKPVLCDNNLLAASEGHFRRVVKRLRKHGWCDFNQGLDARLLTAEHARLIASIGKPMCRLALDHDRDRDTWATAVERLRTAGIAKSRIRSYVICGFDGSVDEDWERCQFVESFGLMALPMWYHPLDAMHKNVVTREQGALGWTVRRRQNLMGWFYKHRRPVKD